MRRSAAMVVAVGLTIGLGACSSSGGESQKVPTKAAYIKAANKICAAANERADKAAEKAGVDETEDQDKVAAFITDVYLPDQRKQVDELRDLGYPKGDEDTLEAMFTDTETAMDKVDAEPKKYLGDDAPDPFADVRSRLTEYGLDDCGE